MNAKKMNRETFQSASALYVPLIHSLLRLVLHTKPGVGLAATERRAAGARQNATKRNKLRLYAIRVGLRLKLHSVAENLHLLHLVAKNCRKLRFRACLPR